MKIFYLAVVAAVISLFSYFTYQSQTSNDTSIDTEKVKVATTEDLAVGVLDASSAGEASSVDEKTPTVGNDDDVSESEGTLSGGKSVEGSIESEDFKEEDGAESDSNTTQNGDKNAQEASETSDDSLEIERYETALTSLEVLSKQADLRANTAEEKLGLSEEKLKSTEENLKSVEEKLESAEKEYRELLSEKIAADSEVGNLLDNLLAIANLDAENIAEMNPDQKQALFQSSLGKMGEQLDTLGSQYESVLDEKQNLIQQHEIEIQQYEVELEALVEKHEVDLQAHAESNQSYVLSVEETGQQLGQLEQDLMRLRSEMDSEVGKREGIIKKLKNETKMLQLNSDVAFRFGSVSPSIQGRELLMKVKNIIQDYPTYQISLEGHTDNVGIRTDRTDQYPSNWELSAGRASAAARFLVAQGVDPERLRVVGLSSFQPIDTNDTEAGRARNRRLEVLFIPTTLAKERIE